MAKVPTHIRIHRPNYNEKDNPSGLMAATNTSSMLLPEHWKLVLKASRQQDQDITDVTGDHSWHKIRVHGVDLTRYRKDRGIELLQEEILHGTNNVQLACTPLWLPSPPVMTGVGANREKPLGSVKITVTNQEEKDQIIKYGI